MLALSFGLIAACTSDSATGSSLTISSVAAMVGPAPFSASGNPAAYRARISPTVGSWLIRFESNRIFSRSVSRAKSRAASLETWAETVPANKTNNANERERVRCIMTFPDIDRKNSRRGSVGR